LFFESIKATTSTYAWTVKLAGFCCGIVDATVATIGPHAPWVATRASDEIIGSMLATIPLQAIPVRRGDDGIERVLVAVAALGLEDLRATLHLLVGVDPAPDGSRRRS
jgi:hypothetical protein